jgi:hypothetical protein
MLSDKTPELIDGHAAVPKYPPDQLLSGKKRLAQYRASLYGLIQIGIKLRILDSN